MENNKQSPSPPTAEERPQKNKQPPNHRVSKVEMVRTVFHLMEQKLNIVIAGDGQCLALQNGKKN